MLPMNYHVEIKQNDAGPLAVVRKRAGLHELSQVVPAACGEVWTLLRGAGGARPGRNVAVYLDDQINLEVGVEVGGPIVGSGVVMNSATPAGRVATTTHWGPYERLGEAHTAILQWCAIHQYALAGPNWEIYGHWSDDPAQLRTDVFYLLDGG
jgi:effector-binding domain-containing protein